MGADRSIGKTLFIISFAVIGGGLLGFSLGQLVIWGAVIAIKLIAPHTNVAALLRQFALPGVILFVIAGVVWALRMAQLFLKEPEERM